MWGYRTKLFKSAAFLALGFVLLVGDVEFDAGFLDVSLFDSGRLSGGRSTSLSMLMTPL